jgi:hypothetical protein
MEGQALKASRTKRVKKLTPLLLVCTSSDGKGVGRSEIENWADAGIHICVVRDCTWEDLTSQGTLRCPVCAVKMPPASKCMCSAISYLVYSPQLLAGTKRGCLGNSLLYEHNNSTTISS